MKTMTPPAFTPAELAAGFRELAQHYELMIESEPDAGVAGFTCCSVRGLMGRTVREKYENLFGLCEGNDSELWSDEDVNSIRVMMLCFAAAVAETGDL